MCQIEFSHRLYSHLRCPPTRRRHRLARQPHDHQGLDQRHNLRHLDNDLLRQGNVLVATDPGSHQTTFSYTDSWGDSACAPPANTQAYPTQITNHLSQNTQIKYFQCTAQPYSVKDPNDIANGRNGTVFTYADSLSRLTKVDFPDTGQTTVAYDDTARTVTPTQKQTSSVNVSETDQFDQLGRLIQRQVP